MKRMSKKGFTLGIKAVALIALMLIVLTAISLFFFSTLGEGKKGTEKVATGAREEAESYDVSSGITSLFEEGKCEGEISSEDARKCKYYYEQGLESNGAVDRNYASSSSTDDTVSVSSSSVEIPSCSLIGGYSLDSWGTPSKTWYSVVEDDSNYNHCVYLDYRGLGTCVGRDNKRCIWYNYERAGGVCEGGRPEDPFDCYNWDTKCSVTCSTLTGAGEESCNQVPGCNWASY